MIWINICYSVFSAWKLCCSSSFYSEAQMDSNNLLRFAFLVIEWTRNRISITIPSSHFKFPLLTFHNGNYSNLRRVFFYLFFFFFFFSKVYWQWFETVGFVLFCFVCCLQFYHSNHPLLLGHNCYTVSSSGPHKTGKTSILCSAFNRGPLKESAGAKGLFSWSLGSGRRWGWGWRRGNGKSSQWCFVHRGRISRKQVHNPRCHIWHKDRRQWA